MEFLTQIYTWLIDPENAPLLALFGILFALLFGLVAIVALKRVGQLSRSPMLLDRAPVMGRLEKLERALNELRSEFLRTKELEKRAEERSSKVLQLPSEQEPAAEAGPSETESVEAGEIEQPPAKLSESLRKTRLGFFERLRSVFSGKAKLDQESLEELKATLIGADLGPRVAERLISGLEEKAAAQSEFQESDLVKELKSRLNELLGAEAPAGAAIKPTRRENGPLVVLVVGVNGVGKTTSIAKLAHSFKKDGASVLLVAADTFRAAAVEQLSTWAERAGAQVVTGAENAKPATVVFDGMQRAVNDNFDVVIIDTAGRLHNKLNLMQELEGVKNAISRHQSGAPHETFLVLDASTGQNAINQAREFNDVCALSGLIMTKLDGTPKGGVVVAIKEEIGVPVRYIGIGEGLEDLRPFNAGEFVDALFDKEGDGASTELSSHGAERRRRREAA